MRKPMTDHQRREFASRIYDLIVNDKRVLRDLLVEAQREHRHGAHLHILRNIIWDNKGKTFISRDDHFASAEYLYRILCEEYSPSWYRGVSREDHLKRQQERVASQERYERELAERQAAYQKAVEEWNALSTEDQQAILKYNQDLQRIRDLERIERYRKERKERLAREEAEKAEKKAKRAALRKKVMEMAARGETIDGEELVESGIPYRYIPTTFKSSINYDPDTGDMMWAGSKRKAHCDGFVNNASYSRSSYGYSDKYRAARVAWYLVTGEDLLMESLTFVDGDSENLKASNIVGITSKRLLSDLL